VSISVNGPVLLVLAVHDVSTHVMHAQQDSSTAAWYNRRRMATRADQMCSTPLQWLLQESRLSSCLRVQRRSSDEGPLWRSHVHAMRHYWPCMQLHRAIHNTRGHLGGRVCWVNLMVRSPFPSQQTHNTGRSIKQGPRRLRA
jgi:hypothetical protein